MDYEEFIEWKDGEADRLITSLIRLRKHNKHKEVLSTKLVQSILKCSERKGWDYARTFNLGVEIEKFSREYQMNLLSVKSDVIRQNNDVREGKEVE